MISFMFASATLLSYAFLSGANEPAIQSTDNVCCCDAAFEANKDSLLYRKTIFRTRREEDEEEEEGISDRIVTDRPHFSEASSLVGKGVAQLETGYTYSFNNFAGSYNSSHSFPENLFRVGMFVEWFEFRFAYNFLHEFNRDTPGDPSITNFGGDDLYLGAKLALFEQDGIIPEMAIFPQTRIPAGHQAYTAKQMLPGFNLAYSWLLNSLIEIEINTQLNRQVDDNGIYYPEFIQTFNIEYDINDFVNAFTEYFGIFPSGATAPTAGPLNYLHGGFWFYLTPDLQFDIHAGWGLNERSDDFFGGVGLSARFGKPVREKRIERQFKGQLTNY